MKKILYFVPVVLALMIYIALGFSVSFSAINPWVWFWIAILFASAVVMLKRKWYGCL